MSLWLPMGQLVHLLGLAGDKVWGPGGVGDHSGDPWDDVWTQGLFVGAFGRGSR